MTTTTSWDMLIAGGHVVDPRHGTDDGLDIAVRDGVIVEVGAGLDAARAARVEAVRGKTVIPGVIDAHVHMGRSGIGFPLIARTGVVTAIDFSGSVAGVRGAIEGGGGAGLSAGFLKPAIPGKTIASATAGRAEQERFLDGAVEDGALGIKLLGGHYPVSPELFRALVRRAAERGIFVAAHVGTTRHGSNLDGLHEAVELADGHPLYIAHVNSYCRGASGRLPVVEAAEALELLRGLPHLRAESYLSRINGTSAACREGEPESQVTRSCLARRGYPATEAGMEAAIRDGYAQVHRVADREIVLLHGADGVAWWREQATAVGASFPVNCLAACAALAAARDAEGDFIIDVLSTDGGCIPRNTLITGGLALCRLGALSVRDFAEKASAAPARIFGLPGKGHLGVGADADLTVLDLETGRACLGVAAGRVIMRDGALVGTDGTFISRR